jgi:curved DNA-binding protein CbpA
MLEVPQGSFNTGEIKKNYRRLAKIMHPDKFSDPIEKEKSSAKF